jgi:tRNA1Val (adenine37-N6)-methyltransferase
LHTSDFRFKQFAVTQENAALRITTDACALGALTEVTDHDTVLDIGTGTGVLTLMLAQRSQAHFVAIEPHQESFDHALQNFLSSPWARRIQAFRLDLEAFCLAAKSDFSLIICNPPFFSNQLASPKMRRTAAMHAAVGFHELLIESCCRLLNPKGRFHVLLPYAEKKFEFLCRQKGFYCTQKVHLQHSPVKQPHCSIHCYTKQVSETKIEWFTYFDENNKSTAPFRLLMEPYYLDPV